MALRFTSRPAAFLRPSSRCRYYSSGPSTSPKVPVQLIKELRTHVDVTLTKAREALTAANNDVQRALHWLEEDALKTGAAKAEKLAGRVAAEGVVAMSVLGRGMWAEQNGGGVRAAMVELNCETDFVSRSEAFNRLAASIAHTAAFLGEPVHQDEGSKLIREFPLDLLQDAPVIPDPSSTSGSSSGGTIRSAVQDAVVRFGEKISLRRAACIITEPGLRQSSSRGYRLGAYAHGSQKFDAGETGKVSTLLALEARSSKLAELMKNEEFEKEVVRLADSLARQATGMETARLRVEEGEAVPSEADPESQTLYSQPFIMMLGSPSESPVGQVIRELAKKHGLDGQGEGLEAVDFLRWKVGEGIEKRVDDFAEEVKKLAGQ